MVMDGVCSIRQQICDIDSFCKGNVLLCYAVATKYKSK